MCKILILTAFFIFPAVTTGHSESPYAGEETREIKSLSQQEIENYLGGKGMGYAKLAELNHFPGPRHVLDMANALALSESQVKQTKELFNEMQRQAISCGQELVEKERALDAAFADHSIDEARLEMTLKEIAMLQAQIRQTHLVAHLRQKALLSQDQLVRYDRLRGYAPVRAHEHQHGN